MKRMSDTRVGRLENTFRAGQPCPQCGLRPTDKPRGLKSPTWMRYLTDDELCALRRMLESSEEREQRGDPPFDGDFALEVERVARESQGEGVSP